MRGRTIVDGAKLGWRVGGWRSINHHDIIFTAAETIGRAYFRNVGQTRRQGIEAESSLEMREWSASASYVLTDATFRTGFNANSPDNPEADDAGLIDISPGDRLPGIARNRLKASVTRPFGDGIWITVDGQYSSGRWLMGDEASLTQPTKGYWLADIAAGVTPVTQIEIYATVDNLFGRKYAGFGSFSETGEVDFAEAPGIDNRRALSPGVPRAWKLGVRFHF